MKENTKAAAAEVDADGGSVTSASSLAHAADRILTDIMEEVTDGILHAAKPSEASRSGGMSDSDDGGDLQIVEEFQDPQEDLESGHKSSVESDVDNEMGSRVSLKSDGQRELREEPSISKLTQDTDSDMSDADIKTKAKPKRLSIRLFSDESSDETGAKDEIEHKKQLSLGSDSEGEVLERSKPLKCKPFSEESDSDNADENVRPNLFSDDDGKESVKQPERKRTYLTDDSDEEELLDIHPSFTPTKSIPLKGKSNQKEKKKKLPSRKERDETMKKITSQTQKLQRERRVTLPYHKPKQLSLDAFLQRRNPSHTTDNPVAAEVNGKPQTYPAKVVSAKIPKSHIPNLRKINYVVDLTIEEKVLGNNPDFNKACQEDKYSDSEEEEMFRRAEMKKVDDILGTEHPEPTITVTNWLDTTSNEIVVDEDEEMDQDNNSKTVEEITEAHREQNLQPQSQSPDLNVNKPKTTVQQWLQDEMDGKHDETDDGEAQIKQLGENKQQAQENMEVDVDAKVNEISAHPASPLKISSYSIVANDTKIEAPALPATGSGVPKKKSIRELLESLPNYKKIAQLKPTLSKDNSQNFIDLTLEEESSVGKRSESKGSKSKIQALMDRFVKHTIVPKKPQEEHFNVQVCKKIEDSQGVENEVVENFHYVTHNELELEEVSDAKPAKIASPSTSGKTPPGLKFATLQEKLKAQIQARKLKEYEEKVKAYAIYNEEKYPEDKEAEEEIEEDMSSSSGESEPDETDEEALQEYLNQKEQKRKKKGKKLFMDEEAQEVDSADGNDDDPEMVDLASEGSEGEEGADDDEEDEDKKSDMENEDEAEEDAEKMIQPSRKSRPLLFEDSDEDSNEIQEEDVPNVPVQPVERLDRFSEASLKDDLEKKPTGESESEDFHISSLLRKNSGASTEFQTNSQWLRSAFELKDTTPEILLRPLGIRKYGRSNQSQDQSGRYDKFSSPRMSPAPFDSEGGALDKESEEMHADDIGDKTTTDKDRTDAAPVKHDSDKIVDVLNNEMLVPPSATDLPQFTQDEDAMLGLCSAKFPTQQPDTPKDSQYSNFNFSQSAPDPNEDEDDAAESASEFSAHAPVTPAHVTGAAYRDQETPKLSDKITKSRILFRDRDSAENEDKEKTDPETEGIPPIEKKKFSRIQLLEEKSDDEDEFVRVDTSGLDNFITDSEAESMDLEDEENDEEDEEAEKPKPFKAFKTKLGRIRRDLVEDEAELSGSEEASSDEDERNLDADVDGLVNDEDVLDEDVLKAQVEKAHLRQVLDEDQRAIRELQNRFLENGDLHGDGNARQKLFTWGDLDILDDDARFDGMEETVENEADIRWQQEHLDKIKWMNENPQFQKRPESDDEESHSLMKIVKETSQSHSFGIRKNTMRKIESFVSFSQDSMSVLNESSSSRLNSSSKFASEGDDPSRNSCEAGGEPSKSAFGKDAPSPVSPKSKQLSSSFLLRGSPFLGKIAGLNKTCELSLAGSKVNSRKFVFTFQSPSEKETSRSLAVHASAEHKNKRKAKNPAKFQPTKMAKVDPKVGGPSNSRKSTSVFKWIKT